MGVGVVGSCCPHKHQHPVTFSWRQILSWSHKISISVFLNSTFSVATSHSLFFSLRHQSYWQPCFFAFSLQPLHPGFYHPHPPTENVSVEDTSSLCLATYWCLASQQYLTPLLQMFCSDSRTQFWVFLLPYTRCTELFSGSCPMGVQRESPARERLWASFCHLHSLSRVSPSLITLNTAHVSESQYTCHCFCSFWALSILAWQ